MHVVTLSENDIYTGNLILVNEVHGLHIQDAGGLVPALEAVPSVLLRRCAAEALSRLMAQIDGWAHIVPVSGWRPQREQQDIWDDTLRENGLAFTRKYVAVPGHSEHQTGLAIDLGQRQKDIDFICPAFPDTGVCRIFREQAPSYGFILRYPAGKESVTGIGHEPWHFRYVGVPHAQVMAREGLTLEEYICFLKRFPYGSAPCRVQDGGRMACISYLEASDTVRLELPESCSISGNNVDGFILTEWRDADAHET